MKMLTKSSIIIIDCAIYNFIAFCPTLKFCVCFQKPHFKGDMRNITGYTKDSEVTRIFTTFKEKNRGV